MISQGLAVVATILAAVFLVPQLVRLVRHGDASGVSPVWAAFGVITNLAWVVYLGVAGQWIATVAPALGAVSYVAVLLAVARLERAHRWLWCSTAYLALFCLTAVAGGLLATALLLAVTPAIQLAPEITAVYRKPRPTGVSPATWAMAAGEAMCWGAYGLLVADRALVGYGALTTVGAALVLGRWWVRCGPELPLRLRTEPHRRRRTAPRAFAALEPTSG